MPKVLITILAFKINGRIFLNYLFKVTIKTNYCGQSGIVENIFNFLTSHFQNCHGAN